MNTQLCLSSQVPFRTRHNNSTATSCLNLNDCLLNKTYVVTELIGGSMSTQRLTHLGFIPNTPIKIIRRGWGGPVLIEIKGSRLALGRGLASKVIVKNEN